MNYKRFLSIILIACLAFSLSVNVCAAENADIKFDFNAKSAILMDAETGSVLYAFNENASLPLASVTKIMTLLLVFEAIEEGQIQLDTVVSVSEYASSMGGSQVFLEPGEQMSVDELLKCVFVASANDAAVALAELVGGSEESFVTLMNKRAKELRMKNSNFENATGLDDDVVSHYSSAYDIALMSQALLKFPQVVNYSTIWMDTIRNGEFGLSNTNRLVRYYKGVTGLKTGSTDKAGFCLSASAKRDNLHLIAVIMGADTSNNRNMYATKLLDYGFATYSMQKVEGTLIDNVPVFCGSADYVKIGTNSHSYLISKNNLNKLKTKIEYSTNLDAPVYKNQVVGKIQYYVGDNLIKTEDIICLEGVSRLTFFEYFLKIFKNIF